MIVSGESCRVGVAGSFHAVVTVSGSFEGAGQVRPLPQAEVGGRDAGDDLYLCSRALIA